MAVAGFFGQAQVTLLLICISLSFGLWFGRITVYWIMVADAVPKGSAGAAMAIANGVGNLGGFLGPWMFGLLRGQSGGFNSSMMVGGGLYIMAGLLALFVQVRPDDSAKQEAARELTGNVRASPAP